MDPRITGIDHLIVGVRDLEAARAQWARLGFVATPRGRHVGWGTANVCLMFGQDYIELLGIVDAGLFSNGLDRFLAEREGLLGMALGTADPAATEAAWAAAGLAPSAGDLGRLLELPEGPVELRFRNVMLESGASGGLRLFACRHLTPQLLRRPGWTRHPNGALALVACTVVAREPEKLADALGRIFGAAALTRTDAVTAVHTGTAVILIAGPEDAAQLHPGLAVDAGPEPRLEVMAVMVDDADRAARFLQLQGVPFRRDRSGAVLVAPEHATGVSLELVPG
jgi:hypothetical protein